MALEACDNFAALRNGLRRVASDRRDYAGIPMPLEGLRLVIEPTYPKAKELAEIGAPKEEPLPETVRHRNHWYSRRLRAEVLVYDEDGKARVGVIPREQNVSMLLKTLDSASAWGIEQERRAVDLLGTMIRHYAFKQYLLTGMFLERSRRSGVVYLFRRLRPTVAIRADEKGSRILAALCLHPIAYYADSWAGAMTPTDDVVAHLAMMRGDEAMFWRRSNQHAPWRPEAGL